MQAKDTKYIVKEDLTELGDRQMVSGFWTCMLGTMVYHLQVSKDHSWV